LALLFFVFEHLLISSLSLKLSFMLDGIDSDESFKFLFLIKFNFMFEEEKGFLM
jgi:hypothetical protein